MIQAPNELRSVVVGATVNLFVSVGQTSRRLKGTVSRTRTRGSAEEVLEVHVSESTPGGSEIVFWLGFTDGGTFLLPMDCEEDALVYVTYKHGGGRTGLYIDNVRGVDVRTPASGEEAATERRPSSGEFLDSGESELGSPTPENEHRSVR
jgi:hypothetical protein